MYVEFLDKTNTLNYDYKITLIAKKLDSKISRIRTDLGPVVSKAFSLNHSIGNKQ